MTKQEIKAEERRLIGLIQSGNGQARQAKADLCALHNSFIYGLALPFAQRNIPIEDSLQAGRIGLLEAANRFDLTTDYAFLTFGVWYIRQSMQANMRESMGAVIFPVRAWDDALARHKDPDAKVSSWHAEVVGNIGTGRVAISLDTYPVAKTYDDPSVLGSTLTASDNVESESLARDNAQMVAKALSQLTPREKVILEGRCGLNGNGGIEKTLDEIGQELHLSRERVRQIESDGLKRLQKVLKKMGVRG